jgi:SAM-dependent methyltransferase
MRLSIHEVNVAQEEIVPQPSWLARAYLWVCERLYHELAWWYDLVSWVVSAGAWRRWQAGAWREVRGQRVLEVGCGSGAMLGAGAHRGLTMFGVDHSPAMLAVTQWCLMRAALEGRIMQGDGRALPLGDAMVDTVMATFPAGYILETTTLYEMRRVLRDEGRLVILGLWVEVHLGIVGRMFPFFYGRPHAAALAAILRRVAAAGFQAHWVEQREGLFTVGVLVADVE